MTITERNKAYAELEPPVRGVDFLNSFDTNRLKERNTMTIRMDCGRYHPNCRRI